MAQIRSDYRYTITDRLGELIVQPLGENDFSIEWSPEKESGKRFYKKDFGGKIIFTGAAFQKLLVMENSIYRCEYQTVTVERKCMNEAGAYEFKAWFSGQISLNEGDWDLDGCRVTIKFEEATPDQCFEDNKNETVNLLQQVYNRRTVSLFPGSATIETKTCEESRPSGGASEQGYYWCETGRPEDGAWVAVYHDENDDGNRYRRETRWARQRMQVSCYALPVSDWKIIANTCMVIPPPPNGSITYVRPVNVYNCQYTYGDYNSQTFSYTMNCQIFGQSGGVTKFNNGMPLGAVLQAFVDLFCPGITVKSDFFQINPENPAWQNYVTGERTKVSEIIIFQKSDIKRPAASSSATKAEWTFEKLMTHLKFMFNVEWRIEAGKFILEHVSYFTKNIGLNLNDPSYAQYVAGKRKYSYKNEDIPKQEVWRWKEQSGFGDFTGMPITYENGCVTAGSKNATKNYTMDDVITDVEYALQNPAADSKNVSDDGFVFVAAAFDGTSYYILTESGIIGGGQINNTLGISQLLRDYHTYERPLRVGRLNGVWTTFNSVIPTKKGETIVIPFCCEDSFNPDSYVQTPLGTGIVDKATFKFKGSTLALDLLYESNNDLIPNNPPVANSDVFTAYNGEDAIFNVIANDLDPDGGQITALEIMYAPAHGIAVVQPDLTVKYTPTPGYTGNDLFVYRVRDNWGEASNNALVTINVTGVNNPPVAAPDNYSVYQGQALNVPAPGVLGNDSDDVGFTLDIYDAVSANGGTVVMQENGALSYTAPEGFLGDDTFTYRIKDGKGAASTTTVTIAVRNYNYPIANTDNYQCVKDTVLNVDGVAPNVKLTDNDTTPAGGTFTYTTTAQTKPTTGGGTVTIAVDGTFVYTPATGFTGVDTFDYTVSNGTGTDTGTVNITVLPPIYVSLIASDYKSTRLRINCGGASIPGGDQVTQDFVLSFYSDLAGTVPMDVTGLGLTVHVRGGYQSAPGGTIYYNTKSVTGATGTIYKIYEDYVTHLEQRDCNGEIEYYSTESFELLAGSGYTKI